MTPRTVENLPGIEMRAMGAFSALTSLISMANLHDLIDSPTADGVRRDNAPND